jgi:hypothetical protein
LALEPTNSTIDVVMAAEALAATARRQGERPVRVINGTGLDLENLQMTIDLVTEGTARGDWVIVPSDPITDNPAAIALVQATSAALLVVRLGESLMAAAEGTLDSVGRDRFLGSIVLEGATPVPP